VGHLRVGIEARLDILFRTSHKISNRGTDPVRVVFYWADMKKERLTYLILHDIRSAHNVGAIFRTADAAGISKIFLTGYTPAPLDRFERSRKDIAKAALGAEKSVYWEQSLLRRLMAELKKEGVRTVAVEQSIGAKDYKRVRLPAKSALLFGNEVGGLPKSILRMCDEIAEIPMHGKKESLNVSVAAGVALYRMLGL